MIRNQANKEIASRLNITVRTVKFHISSLLNKFGVENRMELARRATGLMESTSVASVNRSRNPRGMRMLVLLLVPLPVR